MLLYNVCYLAYTQAIEIPLSQASDVLSNLWSVCCSAELGWFVASLLFLSCNLLVVIDPVVLTKHTHYSHHLHRLASPSTLHNYSKPLLPLLHRDRAQGARA
jgi:hypothetical protein